MNDTASLNNLIYAAAQGQVTISLPKDLSECLAHLWCKSAGIPLQGMDPKEQARIRNHFSNLVFESQ